MYTSAQKMTAFGANLSDRLQRLEDIEAIRALKARYLNACDLKQPRTLIGCFAPGAIEIDMGHIGRFSSREAFVDLFVGVAEHPHVLDMHQGANPDIEILSSSRGRARWSFDYRNVNTQARTITLASGLYDDQYVKQEGEWRICACKATYLSAIHLAYEDESIASIFTGRSVAGVVDYSQ